MIGGVGVVLGLALLAVVADSRGVGSDAALAADAAPEELPPCADAVDYFRETRALGGRESLAGSIADVNPAGVGFPLGRPRRSSRPVPRGARFSWTGTGTATWTLWRRWRVALACGSETAPGRWRFIPVSTGP